MASTSNSADIGIRVFLQDAASAGLFAIDSHLGRLGQTARTAGLLFGDMSLKLAGLAVVAGLTVSFVGFAGAMVYAVQQGMELKQAMTEISLATGLYGDQLNQVQSDIIDLGAKSIYSLQQLADGVAVVGQYGFKTTEQIKLMTAAGIKLAEATSSDTVSAFKLLSVTMQAFNLPASQANETAALLFYSVEHGTPDIAALTSALGQLGGTAVNLHISLQDIIPALDVVTVGMGSATSAAAGLRYFLINIVHPTSAAAKELDKIGISAFNARGGFIGLQPLLDALDGKLKGLSDKAKADILGTLFNIRSGTAIKQLISQLDEYNQAVKNVSNSSKTQTDLDKAVAKVMDNLGSIWKEVTSNAHDFMSFVGLQIIPILSGFLKNLNPLVAKLREWASDPANAQIIAHVLAIGAAVSGLGLIIIGTVLSPVGAFIGIMLVVMTVTAGVAMGIEWLKTHWASLAPIVNTVKTVLGGLVIALALVGGALLGVKVALLTQAFVALIPKILLATASFLAQLPAMAASAASYLMMLIRMALLQFTIIGGIPGILAMAGAWLVHAAAVALAALPYIVIGVLIAGAVVGLVLLIQHLGFLNTILAIGRQIWAAILPALQQAGAEIKGAFLSAIKQLQPVWQQLVAAFKQAEPGLMMVGKILGVVLVVAIGLVIGLVRGLINVFTAIITTVIHVVAGIIQAFAGIVQFFSGFFTVLHGIFTLNFTEIIAGFKTMGQGILNIVTGLWNAVSSVFVGAFNAIKGFVTGFIQGIINFFTGLWDKLTRHSIIPDMLAQMLSMFLGIGPHVLSAFGSMIGGLISKAGQLPGMILKAVGNVGNVLFNAGKAIVQGFINGIGSMFSSLGTSVHNMLNWVRNLFPHSPAKEGPLVDAHLWMPNLVRILADTAEKSGPSLKASMGRVAGAAKAGLGTATGASGGAGGNGATYNFQVDGKTLLAVFHNQLTGQLQANGLGRMMR